MNRKFLLGISVIVLIAVLISACGSQATETAAPVEPTAAPVEPTAAPVEPTAAPVEPTAAPAEPTAAPTEPMSQGTALMLPEVDPASVMGDIITAGSSTVFPLTEAVANLFKEEGYTGNLTIDSIGTGGGFERFCKAGESDISNASRAIKDEEIANCEAIQRIPVEFRVGTDALAVVVNQDNDFLTDITKEELAKAFSSEVTQWSEIRPEWPAENILRFSPGTDSGTFDYFVEAVMDKVYEGDGEGEKQILSSANIQFSEDDNVLVQGVAGSPYAIGYFGYAYLTENEDLVKTVSIDGIAPTFDTAESGEYPLSRPLFIYSDAGVMTAKPQVASFISFYLTRVNEVIQDVGYFPASEEALNQAKQNWCDATGLCQ
jgi:phosphate transport system substrate-binding protein